MKIALGTKHTTNACQLERSTPQQFPFIVYSLVVKMHCNAKIKSQRSGTKPKGHMLLVACLGRMRLEHVDVVRMKFNTYVSRFARMHFRLLLNIVVLAINI